MKSHKKVAIIGSGNEWSGLPVARELGKQGHKIFVLFQNKKSPVAYSKYVNGGIYQIPKKVDENLFKVILYICKKKKIGYIVCLDEEIKYLLVRNKMSLGEINFAFPSEKSYRIAMGKHNSSAFAKNIGIPVPKTIRLKSKDELGTVEHDFKTPLVVKGERGVSSLHIRYAYSRKNLEKYFDEVFELEKEVNSAAPPPMIQEYIGGPTYLTHAIVQNGKVKVVVPHYKFREWPLSGGVTSRAKTILEPKLVEYTKRILEALNWNGEAGMEWKYDEERDDFYFMEINPRFEGSLDLAVKAGINFPILLIDIMDGNRLPDNIQYKFPVHYRWFYRYDFRCFLYGVSGLFSLLWESFDPRINGEVEINDLRVIKGFWSAPIYEIINFIRKS